VSATSRDPLDLEALLGQIRLAREESEKFSAEQKKLIAEAIKLDAEARKLDRERWFAPALAIAAVTGGLLGVASFIAKLVWG
jgi:hypothetical protein